MTRKPPPKTPNPIEPLLCNHCDHRGLRYQGSRKKATHIAKVYKCVEFGRTSHNPVAERKAKPETSGGLCPRHWVPMDYMARAFKIQTMPWRVEQ